MFNIVYYEKSDGTKPVAAFIKGLDPKMKTKVLREIQLLKEFGNTLGEPHSKSLKNGLFELRIKQGSNISRVLYFFFVGNKIILTNGFVKKEQKTPPSEIELAAKYKADYERRHKNG